MHRRPEIGNGVVEAAYGLLVRNIDTGNDIDLAALPRCGRGRSLAARHVAYGPRLEEAGDDGLAVAPQGAPPQVTALIAAGNIIASTPYKYGGGHGSFDDKAYDCSGSVSYALHGAGLLDMTLDSTALSTWGVSGAGTWITIYANKTHTYLIVAGLRFDTSGAKAAGTRWQAAPRSSKGFKIRHPAGL